MVIPLVMDLMAGNGHAGVFFEAGLLTCLTGGLVALASANAVGERLSIQQTFLLTTGVWVVLPFFGAIPFVVGATEASVTDAYFEAMSGLTTTGATVFNGLDDLPEGLLLWRSMLQWFGGIGIIVVAMAFLPELRVGGMQIFRSEAFDTSGKVLPRAAEIASRISIVYVILTVVCTLCYIGVGMGFFDALNHALTSISTGGFSTRDASFGAFQGPPEYIAAIFMILASLPFVRYVQLMTGTARPLFSDSQIRVFLIVVTGLVIFLTGYRMIVNGDNPEHSFREAIFNVTSIITGTGYASVDYQLWGPVPVVVFFFIGLVGGCAGSTCCSVKIFRYQLLFRAIETQIRRIHSPHGVFTLKYEGRSVGEDVISSVMAFVTMFVVSLGILTVLLSATGLDFVTSVSGAAAALANIGPGLGDIIGPAGNYATLSDTAKWLLTAGMLVGRLELMVVLVIFTARFWRS
ncbi:potassium transporter TrkH [Alphaproteobacteria bacterium GH1-50]|uniref:Trk system potassium uptake protein n=1 Tax=Kangsaoukella pontilimi TaxID=2691042 RepID=A0A7C9MB92_9RHOB|nr:TrkH family potassium uptake protein [Kangsaoukella pontilimi]MXQ06691.1 potassium transporter TrkH [Kangsaoukella pontilimi]